jgi:hypothetical protein
VIVATTSEPDDWPDWLSRMVARDPGWCESEWSQLERLRVALDQLGVIGHLYPVIADGRTTGIHIPGRRLFTSMEGSGPQAVLDALERLYRGLTNPQRPTKARLPEA